jgi:TolA-binding protein
MKKKIIFFFALSSLLGAQEVSVFGAGDLNSKNPYGLNNTEKHILINKKKIKELDSVNKDFKLDLNKIAERIEAIESIYEGDSKKLNNSVLKLNNLVSNIEGNKNIGTKQEKDIEDLRSVVEQMLVLQEEKNIELSSLKTALKELTALTNKINTRYISDNEFKSNMKQFITRSEFKALQESLGLVEKKNNTTSDSNNKKLRSNDKKKILNEAKELFNKRYFKYAIPKFERLVKENYKPAESNFYLGEMWYVRKKYDLAISHFKKSAILYDKAAYMPTLLLHSAISFERVNDKENARSFYNTLIDLYPDSNETKVAKDNLIKL